MYLIVPNRWITNQLAIFIKGLHNLELGDVSMQKMLYDFQQLEVLPKDEQARFIDALLETSSAAQDVFANLRIENAKAYEKKDEVMIMGKVDASAGGRAKVSGHAKVNI